MTPTVQLATAIAALELAKDEILVEVVAMREQIRLLTARVDRARPERLADEVAGRIEPAIAAVKRSSRLGRRIAR